MYKYLFYLLCIVSLSVAQLDQFEPAGTIKSNGSEIKISWTMPYSCDWTGDGKKDLFVGQNMFFENIGEDDAPVFGRYEILKVGGQNIGDPAG